MYKMIMLDLDGTLTDSTGGIADTFNATLVRAGFAPQPRDAIIPLIGLPLATMFERFVPPDELRVVPDLVTIYREIYAAEAIPNIQLFPEVAETLQHLHDAGLVLTIASSKTRPVLQQVLAVCGIEPLFALIMGNDCVQRLKPHPEMLLLTLDQFGCARDEALMVGDSIHDLHMGQAAGVPTCAVTYGAGTHAELAALKPDFMIDHFGALQAIACGQR